ncbi:zinc finger, CCHC-type containing protein [Tanacetum coccineum]
MVEHNNSFRYTDNRGKCKHQADTKADPNKKSKVTCTSGLGNSSVPLKGYNMFNKSLQDYYVTYVSESNYVQDDDAVWAVVRLPNPKLKTLSERGIECIFDGYAEHSKAFRTRDEVFDQHSYYFNVKDKPKTFDEAMKSQDVAFWKEAINDEMNSIMGNNNWMLADLPSVARISTIKLLIALPSIHKLIIHQMDVKTKLLNGELDDEVYMNQTQGFIMPAMNLRFSVKDMGEADVIFGIRIKHEMSTPMDTSEKLRPNNGQVVSQLEYSRAYSQMYNGQSIHLGVRHNMIRGLIINVVVSIKFVRSQQNLADHLTKGLASDLVLKSAKRMGLKSNLVAKC